MATWVRQGTGVAPSTTDSDLVGEYALDNPTAPVDFDPSDPTITVRAEWTITGSGFTDDSWTNDSCALVTAGGTEISQHPSAGGAGLQNTSEASDHTDSTGIPTGLTVAEWEGARVRGDGNDIPNEWVNWNKNMGPDGSTLAVSALTVTITYTPASNPQVIPVGAAGESEALQAVSVVHPIVEPVVAALESEQAQVVAPAGPQLIVVSSGAEVEAAQPVQALGADAAQYFTDFSEYASGAGPPSGWRVTSGTAGVWSVVDDAGVTGGRLLRCEPANGFEALIWDTPGLAVNAVESVGRVRWIGGGTNGKHYFFFSDALESHDQYRFHYQHDIELRLRVGSTELADTPIVVAENTWYWVRLRRQGSSLLGKIWLDGDPEPLGWGIDVTDVTHDADRVMIGGWNASTFDEWDVYGVGINGASAPVEALPTEVVVGQAAETEQAPVVVPSKVAPVTSALESEQADPVAVSGDWNLVDSAYAINEAGATSGVVSVQEGDLIVVVVSERSGYGGTVSVSDDGDAGNPYVEAPNHPIVWNQLDSTYRTYADVWVKVANAIDAGSLTVSVADLGVNQWQSTAVLRGEETLDLGSMIGDVGGVENNVSSVVTASVSPTGGTYLKLGVGVVKKSAQDHEPFSYDQDVAGVLANTQTDNTGMDHGVGVHLDTESVSQALTFTVGTLTSRTLLASYVLIPVAAGAQNIVVGGTSELELAQVVSPLKPILEPVVAVSEAEAAQIVGSLKPILEPVVAVSEAEVVGVVSPLKPITTPVAAASETEQADPVDPLKPITALVGITVETEQADPVDPTKSIIRVVGLASETEAVDAVVALKPILESVGVASESEMAFQVSAGRSVPVVSVSESEVVTTVTPVKVSVVGPASETEQAAGIGAGGTLIVQAASESEFAQLVDPSKPIVSPVAGVSEAESAQTVDVSVDRLIAVNAVSEAEQVFGAVARQDDVVVVTGAVESETAQSVALVKPIVLVVGGALESEQADGVAVGQVNPIGSVAESESAQAVSAEKPVFVQVGSVVETEQAITVIPSKPILLPVGSTSEVEALFKVSPGRSVTVGGVLESEFAQSLTPVKPIFVPVGSVSETEQALVVAALIIGEVTVPIAAILYDGVAGRQGVDAVVRRQGIDAIVVADPDQPVVFDVKEI